MRHLRSGLLTTLLLLAVAPARAAAPVPAAAGPVAEQCREHPEDPGCPRKESPPLVAPAGPQAQPKSESAPVPRVEPGSCAGVKPGSCSGLGGGGGGGGEAVLVLAVVAAAALPVLIYALDDDPSPQVQARYDTFKLQFALYGGGSTAASVKSWGPVAGARFTGGYKLVGLDAQAESGLDPEGYSAAHLHLLLRAPPKEHLEAALAVGGGHLAFDGMLHTGLEVGLPQRYLLWGPEGQGGGLLVEPAVLFEPHGPDFRLECGVAVPLGPYVELKGFTRLYSVEHEVHLAAGGGIGGGF